jgi:hypothetical protein
MSLRLGRLLKDSPDKRSALASTYYDPGKALQMFDDISWAVPNIPKPFVGHPASMAMPI